MSPGLAPIDWSRAWLAPWRPVGEPLEALARREGVPAALNKAVSEAPVALTAGDLRFVEQATLPRGEAYEAFIARTACVPTRSNLHDFFNGLAWLRWPRLKRRLNERQAATLASAGGDTVRGALRDALTVFDENGAMVWGPPPLVEALRAGDWPTLFADRRALWGRTRLELFGHALLEKLVHPRKPITAHVLSVGPGGEEGLVDALAEAVSVRGRAAGCFMPLPVLGVPGWWTANQAPDFYADPAVFRVRP